MEGVLRVFIGIIILGGLLLFIYLINTPKEVKISFAKKFPMATDVFWERESLDEWEAEFKMQDNDYSAIFLENGNWVEFAIFS